MPGFPLTFPFTYPGDEATQEYADATGTAIVHELDYCAAGQKRLLFQFWDKPRINELLCVFLDQLQEAENAYWQLFTGRGLDFALGAQLDGLGQIVGEKRQGKADALYRLFIRVRIMVNRSSGHLDELALITLALLDGLPVILDEWFMAVVVEIPYYTAPITAADILRLLKEAKDGGVKLYLVEDVTADDPFVWGDLYAEDDTTPDVIAGWGSSADATMGGDLSSVLS